MVRTLDLLPQGSQARITHLTAEGHQRRRLLDLGFLPGTRITALQEGPTGDPVAYTIRGTVIALRRQDARRIYIDQIEKGSAPF